MTTPPADDPVLDAVLFDMDGTILTSIAAVERAWTAWAERVGVSPADVLAFMHGRRGVDTVSHFVPADADIAGEVAWVEAVEMEDVSGIRPIPGAAEMLASLPVDRWAVVTSATAVLARRRIAAAGLPLPKVLVTADDVSRGKPDPEGYRLAATRLGARIERCAVFEDAEAGLAAGRAAGATVVQITADAAHTPHRGDIVVADYAAIGVEATGEGIRLRRRG